MDTVCTVNFVLCCCRQDRVMLLLDTNVFHDDYNGASGGFPTLQRVIDEFGSWSPPKMMIEPSSTVVCWDAGTRTPSTVEP